MSATPTPSDADRPGPKAPATGARTAFSRLYRRDLAAYPATGRRTGYLAIVVITTVVLYYMLYIQYAVATSIITHFGMTYRYFMWISVIGSAAGAFASLVAGLADRWGRANPVVYGLLAASLLVFLGLPNAGGKTAYPVLFALVSFVEGIVLAPGGGGPGAGRAERRTGVRPRSTACRSGPARAARAPAAPGRSPGRTPARAGRR
jgi:hypothetical protein